MKDDFQIEMNEYLPLRDVVFNTLRQAILRGELQPGERLMEIQLAQRLGVSRTPVRDEYVEHIVDKKCRAKTCQALRQYKINPEFCKGCSKCARNCPVGAITGQIKKCYHIDPNICIKCGACKDNCAFDAIYVEA